MLWSFCFFPFPLVFQSPFGTLMLLRRTQTCLQDGWECEIHQAHTTGISPREPLSGSRLRPSVKLVTPWCPPLCPWRRLHVKNLKWVFRNAFSFIEMQTRATRGNNSFCYNFQESWTQLSSAEEGAEGELWKVSAWNSIPIMTKRNVVQ